MWHQHSAWVMDVLRQAQRACRCPNKSALIFIHGRNVFPSFRTYCASTVRAEQAIENTDNNLSKKSVIDERTITRIEKLALVGFEYKRSKQILEEAITFTERLRTAQIDETVHPMYSTLQNEHIYLREDILQQDVDRQGILKNAAVLEAEYFVTPLVTHKSNSRR